jgi:two-component system alkaline phosphatase synthesis response regulator PhoP
MNIGAILIIEDEKNLGTTLNEYLQSIGHTCYRAKNCDEAVTLFNTIHPSIVLMDIGLPDGDGFSLAKKLRNLKDNFVLLFLSAQNDPETRVQGLELGALDFITKPFALKELTLRLDRIIQSQRSLLSSPEVIEHGKLKIWFNRYEVEDARGTIIPLSQKECAILKLLYEKSNHAVNRMDIIEEIWGEEKFPSNRTVDNYIVKLRKWCDSDSSHQLQIKSIRGVGYKMILTQGAQNGPI